MCDKCGTPFDFAVKDDTLCAECLSAMPEFEKMRNVAAGYGMLPFLILGFHR
jgi:predicted amidophosphoribosyltransferase